MAAKATHAKEQDDLYTKSPEIISLEGAGDLANRLVRPAIPIMSRLTKSL